MILSPILLLAAASLGLALLSAGMLVIRSPEVLPGERKEQKRQDLLSKNTFLLVFPVMACNLLVACVLDNYYGAKADHILLTLGTLSFLWPCALIDRRMHLIPNRILILAVLVRTAWFVLEAVIWPEEAQIILLSSGLCALIMFLTSMLCRLLIPKSVGMGDVKILAVMGAYLGMDKIWGAIFSSFIVLFFVCLFLLITRRANRSSEIAFAPFLLIGTILGALLTGI